MRRNSSRGSGFGCGLCHHAGGENSEELQLSYPDLVHVNERLVDALPVILNGVKDLARRTQILRCAQDDKPVERRMTNILSKSLAIRGGQGDHTMSQQEFVPRSESNGQDALNDEDEIYQPQYPYHWSGKLNKEGGPRDEPPSSYAEPMMQRGYQAQDYRSTANQQHNATNNAGQQWSGNRNRGAGRQFGPDGDAFEQGYRPYNAYNTGQGGQGGQWNVPPWARPQPRKRGSLGWLFIIILAFFLIRPILAIFGFVLAGIGATVFALVLPLILILMMISVFGFIVRSAFWPGRYRRFRRGPFWW